MYQPSKYECIEKMKEVANLIDNELITRRIFREVSCWNDSIWEKHFGSFNEFKVAAGFAESRFARRLTNQTAKHAAHDQFEKLQEAKETWGSRYLRPPESMETILIGSDIHDIDCDPFWRRLFIDTAKRSQPNRIILNGDTFDLPEFSKYSQDPRSFQLVERFQWVHLFLKELREAAPNAEITMIEGNHEFRLLRHMSEKSPATMVLLSDWHGFDFPHLLKLSEYEINYVARASFKAFTERDIRKELERDYVVLHDCLLVGHYPHMARMGLPGTNGHHHKYEVRSYYSPIYGSYQWVQTGSGCMRRADYCAAEIWNNGFLMVHVDTVNKRSQFEYFDTTHDACFIGGHLYRREPHEKVVDR